MKIKSCPFCGSNEIEFTTFDYHSSCRQDTEQAAMQCQTCDSMGGVELVNIEYHCGVVDNDFNVIKNRCIENWNRRVDNINL
jgi:hypothetical protein